MLDAGVPAFGAQPDVAPRRRDLEHAETGCGVSKPNVHPTVRVSGLSSSEERRTRYSARDRAPP
jgi:hypothetical protein